MGWRVFLKFLFEWTIISGAGVGRLWPLLLKLLLCSWCVQRWVGKASSATCLVVRGQCSFEVYGARCWCFAVCDL